MPSAPSPAEAARDPRWLAHRYDPASDTVTLLPLARMEHARATFLTDDYLPVGREGMIVPRRAAAAAAQAGPIHFVFHSAFCLSTLVARAFDLPGVAMGLKEPPLFNDVVGWRRRGEPGPDMAEVLDDLLTLLARPFAPGEAVVVKPSNVAAGLYPALLALRPEARGLLLHAPLRTFLASVAKKGIDGRLWVRTMLTGLLDDRLIDLGMSPRDHLGQTDLQVAAVGWLAQQALFARLIERFGGRLRSLDSATLTADPGSAMAALSAHFGLNLGEAGLSRMLSGPAFTRHSKTDDPFAFADRAAEHDAAATLHADEIEKCAVWAEVVAKRAGVPMTLANPLLERRA
ncbi:hypothetical protein [Sphingomonas jatrophae]|uniref:Sulfotransferase family protein n=1 Tax=Sphingomonas jatrophae TaxID=1166337 RepID=A0A1I6M6W5_9SPHN|nr:hypothetical protein [Sphingomonas jatrophae]SFS11459.1 hypothetical protein SAMN05192580_3585 [Sphingomonas jatrophae]